MRRLRVHNCDGVQNAHAELQCQSVVSLEHVAAVCCASETPVVVKMALVGLVHHVRFLIVLQIGVFTA